MSGQPITAQNAHELAADIVLASLFANPQDHGLTPDEVLQIGQQLGAPPGRMKDGIEAAYRAHWIVFGKNGRYVAAANRVTAMMWFHVRSENDVRNPAAFDAVQKYLCDLADQVTAAKARAQKDVLVAHAVRAGISERDALATIELMLLGAQLVEEDSLLRLASPGQQFYSHVEQFRAAPVAASQRPVELSKLMPLAAEVINRREPGRATHPEPLIEFEHRLKKMGKDYYSDWWRFIRNELALMGDENMPTAVVVHCGSLCEGALSLVVEKGRSINGSLSQKLSADPRDWRYHQLLTAAKMGVPPIIKDEQFYQRCMVLNATRQRIHAGRLIAEPQNYPRPDARPEEAREARMVADLLVRAILDWLDAVEKQAIGT